MTQAAELTRGAPPDLRAMDLRVLDLACRLAGARMYVTCDGTEEQMREYRLPDGSAVRVYGRERWEARR